MRLNVLKTIEVAIRKGYSVKVGKERYQTTNHGYIAVYEREVVFTATASLSDVMRFSSDELDRGSKVLVEKYRKRQF